ncbi:MAG: fatty acid desaturase, partial [Pseudomonadota bacterium]
FFMFMYIRAVAEHFGSTMDYSNELTGTRTTIVGPIERFFFAPHNVSYHADHHMFPSVPFYRLPELHEKLMANPSYAKNAHVTYGFTTGLWRELICHFDPDQQKTEKQQENAV